MDHRHSYDIERRRELHVEIDKLPIPEDRSNSDISGEFTPNRSRADRSPTLEQGDSFANSINSTIPQGSPGPHFEDPRAEESESERGSFTQQQVNKVMDWSQTHITPSEGRFPQVSAPTMEIESEENEFELVEGFNEPISAVEHADDSVSKDKSLDFESIRSADLPMAVPSRKGKESLTFSPSRQQSQPWFFTPGARRPSKHSATHSGNSSEVLGSALLSGPNISHQGDSAYKTALDNSVMQDEVYKLKTASAHMKAELKAEQEARFQAEQDLKTAVKTIETLKNDLTDQAADAEERYALLRAKTKDSSTLEELRGRQLEFSRAEVARVKTALADREAEFVALQHALSQKMSTESPNTRDKEIEEMAIELSKVKILNTAANRKAQELAEKLEMANKQKVLLEEEVNNLKDGEDATLEEMQRKLDQRNEENKKLQTELRTCQNTLKDCQGSLNVFSDRKSKEQEEIHSLKLLNEILQKENEDLKLGIQPNVDYQLQINKLKNSYETTIAKLRKQTQDQGDEKWLKKEEEWKTLERDFRTEIDALKAEAAEFESEYDTERNKFSTALMAEQQKVMDLKREIRRLESELLESGEIIKSQNLDLENSKAARIKAEEAAEGLRHVQASPKGKRSRRQSFDPQIIDDFQQQIEKMKIDQETLVLKSEQEKVRLEQELGRLRLKKDTKKKELTDFRAENQSLKRELADLRHQLDPRRKELTISEEFEAKLSELAVSKPTETGNPSECVQTSFDSSPRLELTFNKPQETDWESKVRAAEEAISSAAALQEERDQLIDKLEVLQSLLTTPKMTSIATNTEDLGLEIQESEDCRKDEGVVEELKHQISELETQLEDETGRLKNEIERLEEELASAKQETEDLVHTNERTSKEMKRALELQLREQGDLLKQQAKEQLATLKREHERQLSEVQTEFQTELEGYRKRQSEMMGLQEQLSKATSQQSQDALLQTLKEKEEEWQQLIGQHDAQLKTTYEQKLLAKDKQLEDLRSELLSSFEKSKAELVEKGKEDLAGKLEKAKQEQNRMRREHDREVRTLQEELEHVSDKARKELELEYLAKLTAEKKEGDRRVKLKAKVMLEKHQQDLIAQEALLKMQFEKTTAETAKSLSDQHKAILKQKEADFLSEIHRIRQEHEDAMRQLTFEKSQMASEYERRLKRVPTSLEASMSEFPYTQSRPSEFRASKSGFQDSVLTINDFTPEESELTTGTQNNNDRVKMMKEDLRSFFVAEADRRLEQKLLEKAKIQKFVDLQCQAARDSEQRAMLQTVSEELDRVLTGSGPRPKSQHKEVAKQLQDLFSKLKQKFAGDTDLTLKEVKTAQDVIVQKYRTKISQLETALVQKAKKDPLPPDTDMEDSVFVRWGGHLYISLKCTVNDLALVCESFDGAIAQAKKPSTPKRGVKTMDPGASLEKQKDTYRALLNALQRCSADVSWALRNQVKERTITHDNMVECKFGEEEERRLQGVVKEYEEKLEACQLQLLDLNAQYQSCVQDATGSISDYAELKQEWEAEKEALLLELQTAKDKLREWEDNSALIPEMLSPSETCELVFSIFNRSNRETFLHVMTNEHPEFLSLLQEFVEAADI